MRAKQPCSLLGQCRRRAGSAPGAEQMFPADHDGAECPTTAHGHHLEQISLFSHGGANSKVDEAWRKHSPWRAATGATLGQSYCPWRGVQDGEGGLLGICVEQCLKAGPCGMELYHSSTWRNVGCGKPTRGQFGKDGVQSLVGGETPHGAGAESDCEGVTDGSIMNCSQFLFPRASQEKEIEVVDGKDIFSLLLVSYCAILLSVFNELN